MGFVLALVAVLAIWAAWNYFWKDVGFVPYLTTVSVEFGPKAKFWYFVVAAVLALGGVLTNSTVPPALSLLLTVVVAVFWLTSPNGQKWFKETL